MRSPKKKPFSVSRKRSKFKVTNWSEYNNILRNRGRIGGLSVNLRFFRKSLNELGNTVLFRYFCTRVSMD